MKPLLSDAVLCKENELLAGTGGVSQENRTRGFIPAFYDTQSYQIAICRFGSGVPAPIHVLDGVPEEWVVKGDPSGKVIAVRSSVIAGFLHRGRFYTRAQAARALVGRLKGKARKPDLPQGCDGTETAEDG